jgi:5-methylcytosine-specific restriction protein A
MQIADLPQPVTAAKSDWVAGTNWLGFTPNDSSPLARERCRAVITRQMANGYVLEYITSTFGEPNPGFEERIAEERANHRLVAGKLIAVHRLRPSSRPLKEILGEAEYDALQDIWATDGRRFRWSVAFPIIESYSITGAPFANEVFDRRTMNGLFAHPSATLRPLHEDARRQIQHLTIERRPIANAWIGIADEIEAAERSEIPSGIQKLIDHDLSISAMEGKTEQQKQKIRIRAAWLAHRFAMERARSGRLFCDDCGFDPTSKISGTQISPRSLLDVHHKSPLDEGERITTLLDFLLLCPNCHRFIHALARANSVH